MQNSLSPIKAGTQTGCPLFQTSGVSKTSADEVIEIEKDLLREHADSNLKEPPADLIKRGGAHYSTVAMQLLNAHYNDLGETHVVNIKNNRAVKEQLADLVLESPSTVRENGRPPSPRNHCRNHNSV